MSIHGVTGRIGSGKSFLQLKSILDYAEQREKQIVLNFRLNLKELEILCRMPKWIDKPIPSILLNNFPNDFKYKEDKPRYPWILNLIKNGGISFIPNPANLQSLLFPDSVVGLDEAGIYLNSRDFQNTPKELLADLCQSRKDGTDLFWCSQFDEQVDKQFRMLTQFWIHSDGIALYDKKLKRPKLIYKKYFYFTADSYFDWVNNRRDRTSHFKTRFLYASKYEGGFLCPSDYQLFKVFDSFSRLDISKPQTTINSIHQSPLSSSYYKSRMGSNYSPSNDPFSYRYTPPPPYQPPLHIPAPSKSSSPISKSFLIRQALSISKQKRLRSPIFKDMTEHQLNQWISKNK